MLSRLLYILGAVTLPLGPCFAQDKCADILENQVIDYTTSSGNKLKVSASKHHACQSSFEEIRDEQSGDLGGSYKFFSADGSFSKAIFQSWQKENCSDQSAAEHQAAFQFLSQQIAKDDTVSAWRACMLDREGLNCWV